ncbi:hypothetical protein GQ457_09G005260 [Hibiscus cannabinus]
MLAGLERMMKAADCVRLKTLKGVLDVLNPSQSLDFLAGTCMLQIQLRKWGQRQDIQKGGAIEEKESRNNHKGPKLAWSILDILIRFVLKHLGAECTFIRLGAECTFTRLGTYVLS